MILTLNYVMWKMYKLLPCNLKTTKTWATVTADCFKQDQIVYMTLY